jgi:lipopolysaccharide export system permease protein
LNTFDRHLLREWLTILGLVLCAMLGLLLVQVLYDDFRSLREVGARLADLVMYLIVTIPSYLALILPLSLLVSLMFVLGKLHRANELTALRAAGVGFGRITAPVWIIGVMACTLSWWLNTRVVPWSVKESSELRDYLQFRKESGSMTEDRVGAVYSVGFNNPQAGRMWFFNRYSQLTKRGYGVTVSLLDDQRREVTRITASEAWLDQDDPERGWVFKDGRELSFRADTSETQANMPFVEKLEPTFHEDPRLMLLMDRKPSDLSLPQLRSLIDYFAVAANPKGTRYAVRYFSLIADTIAPLIVIAIAIPFAITGVRVNPAVGVSKSIGLFFIYYILATVASALATKQIIEPKLAAWIPNVGMTGLAIWLFARLR